MAATRDDALMFRDVEDGTGWDVLRIPASRVEELERKGWTLLISARPLERDIRETYAADVTRYRRRG